MSLALQTAKLTDRALVLVTGEEAEKFLQAVITTDLDQLGKDDLMPGALLAPQGKIMFDFLVSRVENGLRFDLPVSISSDFAKRLTLYRLRAKAEIVLLPESLVSVSWQNDSDLSQSDSNKRDRRFPDQALVVRHYGRDADTGDMAGWTGLRIAHGVSEGGSDYAFGDAFPHDVNLDQTGGVSFKKGCFIGQEVVSRMQHRGTARRRALIATASIDLPETGTALTVNGREIGTLGSVSGAHGLALARIDRVKDAIDSGEPIMAGDVTVALAIPPEAKFSFPNSGTDV